MTSMQQHPTPSTAGFEPSGPTVMQPGHPGYDGARGVFNLTIDQRPAAIAHATSADDVAALMAYARERGLRVAPQSTGHNAGPLGDLSGTLLLRTEHMKGVTIDAATRTARVNAGATWEDVTGRAAELGLAALHGSSPDVGVVGYCLGGGMGWYARKWGLAANHVTAIELVTVGGELIRATPEQHQDLFWALRGGNGNFGVVTALEFRLFPVEEVYAGVLFFPLERASEVLRTWNGLLASFPDEITSVGRLLQVPPIPEAPEPLRGRAFVVVEAAYLGTQADGDALLEPLRALGPEIDTFAMVPPIALAELHMDPRDPVPAISGHALLGALPEVVIDQLVAAFGTGGPASPLVSLELRHTGAALARPAADHGARGTLPGSLCLFALGVPFTPEVGAAIHASLAQLQELVAPLRAGEYLNFVEHPSDARQGYERAAWDRLLAVRGEHDPSGVMHANHDLAAQAV